MMVVRQNVTVLCDNLHNCQNCIWWDNWNKFYMFLNNFHNFVDPERLSILACRQQANLKAGVIIFLMSLKPLEFIQDKAYNFNLKQVLKIFWPIVRNFKVSFSFWHRQTKIIEKLFFCDFLINFRCLSISGTDFSQ